MLHFLIVTSIIVLIILVFIVILLVILFSLRQTILLFEANNTLHYLTENELNQELEPYGFAYNPIEDIFFSIMHPWQREYGYCHSYDEASPFLALIIDSEPIYFEYNNRKWLIEIWKGQYGLTTGAEIGIYVSDKKDDYTETIYNSITDEEILFMSYILKKKDKVIITRKGSHWWLTGFKLGEFSKPSNLSMDISITLENEIMRDAFVSGLKKTGYPDNQIEIVYNTVYFNFSKPFTKQPKTKNKLIVFIMQLYNKHNCKIYNSLTKDYTNSLDKINYIRSRFPILYEQIINIGKNKQLFKYINFKPNK